MADPLDYLQSYVGARPGMDVRVVLGQPSAGEEMPMRADVEVSTQKGRLVEDGGIAPVNVGAPTTGMFTCFMDGMQRHKGPIYLDDKPIPVMYGYVAAVIRSRGVDRRMRSLPGFHDVDKSLYVHKGMAEKHGLFLAAVDTEDPRKPVAEHPLALKEAAIRKINKTRSTLEDQLAARWHAEYDRSDEWLLLDGALQSDYGEDARIVGFTKSHGTQYLEWDDQARVLSLRVGERSGAFIPVVNESPKPVYSWYLRMHPSEGRDPYFGLVRVEAPRSARALGMVDEISRWLLSERAPLSLPDSRWDKMIYPIRDCEQFMKSVAPTHTALDARLMRLGSLGTA